MKRANKSLKHHSLSSALARMSTCPHCSESTISAWKKSNASSIRPARCPSCGGLSYVSGWYHTAATILNEVILWGGIIAAVAFHSWLVLFVALALLLVSLFLYGSGADLRAIDTIAVSRARKILALEAFVITCIILVAYLLFAR